MVSEVGEESWVSGAGGLAGVEVILGRWRADPIDDCLRDDLVGDEVCVGTELSGVVTDDVWSKHVLHR